MCEWYDCKRFSTVMEISRIIAFTNNLDSIFKVVSVKMYMNLPRDLEKGLHTAVLECGNLAAEGSQYGCYCQLFLLLRSWSVHWYWSSIRRLFINVCRTMSATCIVSCWSCPALFSKSLIDR